MPIYSPSTQNASISSVPGTFTSVPSSSSSAPNSTSSTYLGEAAKVGIPIGVLLSVVIFVLIAFYFGILKPKYARMNVALRQRHDQILKPELDAEETEMHEVDGKAPLSPEIDKRQTKIYELPAIEEVASEMGDSEVADFQG
jgi:hypothetical protein